ncbi:MAG TPA: glycosyltransferase [Solirubrobacteraceae bacterium]|jgi:glycosyltransferase involved in cell wall biosynthesis|nr:glycosyltransferase [Solirubrobacteraceae bacterium]
MEDLKASASPKLTGGASTQADERHRATRPVEASVIICAYTLDRWEELACAVQSVLEQTLPPREVTVVVDNNPELLARASEWFDGVQVVANHHGPGLSGARNTGADVSSGSILAFLDDDGTASPRWLEEHVAGYSDPSVLGVGGDVIPAWRSDPPVWLPRELYWVVGCTYTGLPVEPAPIRNPIGANMSIRADVFAGAGGFQHELGRLDVGGKTITGTADETEFCIRASRHYPDGQWTYRPAASIRHVVTPHRTTWRYFVERCRLEGGSKAVLVGLRGGRSGLASERRYVARILPLGVLRELQAAARGEPCALQRAAAICAGLGITTLTYLRARAELALGGGQRYSS